MVQHCCNKGEKLFGQCRKFLPWFPSLGAMIGERDIDSNNNENRILISWNNDE